MSESDVNLIQPRAALFDLDGTLINSEPRSAAVWARLLSARGVPHDDMLLRAFMGRRGGDVIAEHPDLFPGVSFEQLAAEIRMHGAAPGLPPVGHLPESVAFLHRLHAQEVPFALVTSAGRDWAESALEQLGVREMFQGLITAGDVTVGKPDPQGYLSGAEIIDHAPENIVVFEDTPAGILAGKGAGMNVIGITTTHPADALAGADLIVDHLTEVDWPRIALRSRFD